MDKRTGVEFWRDFLTGDAVPSTIAGELRTGVVVSGNSW